MAAAKPARGQLRIIAGRNRGRRLSVPDEPGLRPTADRIRETLFNWLAPVIEGSRCLDCFAGSGALGFEAASRSASDVVLIERAPGVVRQLAANAALLGPEGIEVHCADALRWLERPGRPFDIVFLDPPFDTDLLEPACAALGRNAWLKPGARVYLEAAARRGFPDLPEGWDLIRDKTAGQVRYGLALVSAPLNPAD